MNITKSIIVKISLAGFLALALHLNANACPNCRDATRNSPEASQEEQYKVTTDLSLQQIHPTSPKLKRTTEG